MANNILYISDGDYGSQVGQMLPLVQGQFGQSIPLEIRDLAGNVANLTGYSTITGHKRKGGSVTAIVGTFTLSGTPTVAPQIAWGVDEDDTGDYGTFHLFLEITNGSITYTTHPVNLQIVRDPTVNATPAAGLVGVTTAQKALLATISGLTGLVKMAGGAASAILIKLDGTAAPGVNDDSGDGYSIGSIWVDTTNDNAYIATDVTVGAANWEQINGAGAGASDVDDLTTTTGTSSQMLRVAAAGGLEYRTVGQVLDDLQDSGALATTDIGVSVQAYSAKTAAIAALTWAANNIILLTGTATASVQALAAHVVTFIQSATAADARTAIGAGTGNGDLLAANNLSDVTASTARTNLAVPGLATANTFTAAQMVDGTADAIQLRVQGHSTQTNIFQTWEDSSANVLAAVTKIDTNSGRINNYVGNAIVSSWYPSGSTVRFTTASGYDLTFLNHGAELMRGTSLGRLGIGTTAAQGKLHVYDTAGSFMHVYKSGVVGSATTIISNGTGDVTLCLSGTFTISDGAGNVAGGVITNTVPTGTFNLYDDGGTNTCQLQIAADGSVTVIRTAGSRTYAVNLVLNWM